MYCTTVQIKRQSLLNNGKFEGIFKTFADFKIFRNFIMVVELSIHWIKVISNHL